MLNSPGLQHTVEELLTRWPASARLFIAYHLACIGCEFASFHTLEDVIRQYGVQQDEFMNLLWDSTQTVARPNQIEKDTQEE